MSSIVKHYCDKVVPCGISLGHMKFASWWDDCFACAEKPLADCHFNEMFNSQLKSEFLSAVHTCDGGCVFFKAI